MKACHSRSTDSGNTALVSADGADTEALRAQADARRGQGARVMYVGIDGHPGGLLAMSDAVEGPTPEALARPKAEGSRAVMGTGDGVAPAKTVGARLGTGPERGVPAHYAADRYRVPDPELFVIRRLGKSAGPWRQRSKPVCTAPTVEAALAELAAFEQGGCQEVSRDLPSWRRRLT